MRDERTSGKGRRRAMPQLNTNKRMSADLSLGVQNGIENHVTSDTQARANRKLKPISFARAPTITAVHHANDNQADRDSSAESILLMRPRDPLTRQPKTSAKANLKSNVEVRKGRATSRSETTKEMRGQSSTVDHYSIDNQSKHVNGGEVHGKSDIHLDRDFANLIDDGQPRFGNQTGSAIAEGEDHGSFAIQQTNVLTTLIDEIIEQWRRRQMWHRAEKSLTLQAKSMCRRLLAGDKTEAEVLYKSALNGGDHEKAATAQAAMLPLLAGREVIEKHRDAVEKRLVELVRKLPIAAWVESTHGLGWLGVAGIVGESGDLGGYANPAKLWKRMGLAVMPDGDRQRIVAGDAAIEHGYNPARRSVMWTIGDVIVKVGGPYRLIYDARKVYESEKNERGEYAERAARMLKQKTFAKNTNAHKCYSEGKLPPLHLHNSAKRYMEKRLLRDLWRAWRDAKARMQTIDALHLSEPLEAIAAA